ncbi:phenylacetate--CoA ligase family protein [Streptomyces sodiiphilus]
MAAGSIGRLPVPEVLAHADRLARTGGPSVPQGARELADLPVTGPAEVLGISRNAAERHGALLLSSGGTTGEPKLTFVPHHQAVERLSARWRPLVPGSIMLNAFNAGRMWASHYYMQRLAEHSGATVIPFGPLTAEDAMAWAPRLARIGVTAVAGTPTGLADLAEGVLAAGAELPVKTVIWMAEPWTDTKRDAVTRAFPQAGFWGNYGSVETYVIAVNDPRCDPAVLHLLPEQVLEPDDGGALLTRVGEGWTVPVVRYRLGDRVAPAECRCGRGDGLRVLGRADDMVKFRGATFGIGEVLDVVRSVPGVTEAQLGLAGADGDRRTAERLTVRFLGTADAEDVTAELLRAFDRFRQVMSHHPKAVTAVRAERLARIDRTTKVPPATWSKWSEEDR